MSFNPHAPERKAVQLGFQQTLRIVKVLCPCSSSLIAMEKKKATKTNKQETKRDGPEYFSLMRRCMHLSATWTHKFVALADCEQEDVPTAYQKYELKNAALGRDCFSFKWLIQPPER